MRIKEIAEEYIEFDNGNVLSYWYSQRCCENNYADFKQIDDLAKDIDFDENLTFESCEYGFRFGNPPVNMFFIPCYSEQNGYYSDEINITYNGDDVIKKLECDVIYKSGR